MVYWNRSKSRNYSKKQGGVGIQGAVVSPSEVKITSSIWTAKDRQNLIQFLCDYRDAATRVYHDLVSETANDHTGSNPSPAFFFALGNGHLVGQPVGVQQQRRYRVKSSYRVGSIGFPMLTQALLEQPYFALPTELTSKQRRMVHDCCFEVGLYHSGVDNMKGDRFVVISIYADGLKHVPNLERPDGQGLRMHMYRPWYCRKLGFTNGQPIQNDLGKYARRNIEKLIDQPGNCLRDTLDDLDLTMLQQASLASIDPPSLEPNDKAWMLVDTTEKVKQCIHELNECKPTEIAFDLEAYNASKYTQLICLLQITTNHGKEYVIDTLAPGVWDEISGLASLFADPNVVKVGHGIGGLDVRSLHRDFGIFVVNVFDTYEAAKVLHLPTQGLASVCAYYGLQNRQYYIDFKSKYQASDWRVRPLTDPMILYGRYDIHYLLALRKLMIRDLTSDVWGTSRIQQQRELELVSESLALTLHQIKSLEEEDGSDNNVSNIEYVSDTTGNDGPRTPSHMDILADNQHNDPNCFNDADSDSYITSKNTLGDDDFYTPADEMSEPDSDEIKNMDEEQLPLTTLVVSKLRLHPRLMRVISMSQHRCLDLWNLKVEPHLKNGSFRNMMMRAQRGEIVWTEESTKLYEELTEWRNQIAEDLECLPGFVIPLDALAMLALKQPLRMEGIRRILYFLPQALEENEVYHEQLLSIIAKSRLQQQQEDDNEITITDEFVCFYAEVMKRNGSKKRMTHDEQNSIDDSDSWFLWKIGLVALICVSTGFVVISNKRRRR